MTLQIRSTDTISGIPIKQVRSFFRRIVSWHNDSFELPRLQDQLSLDEKSTRALALELVAQAYVEPLQNNAYRLTNKAEALVRSSAAGKVSRETAGAALDGLLERVARYNSDATKILTIIAVVVFGSFLGTKEKLGDLDVAVKCRDRNVNDRDPAETALAYAERSGRRFSNFVEWLSWPNTELCQILKARKRTIQIQDWDSFTRVAAQDPDGFHYKVVFGSSEEVETDIRARTKKASADQGDN
jgi:predicted nucleotidyltransferase